MTNVSISEVNMLKNISTHAASIPINLSFKFGFVSVNGPRESSFVDAPRSRKPIFCRLFMKASTVI